MATIASLTSREYTSGSCTLTVTGQLSALSQVAQQPVLMRSRFRLQLLPSQELDDISELLGIVSSPATAWSLAIEGRARQLVMLTNAVSSYVQQRLSGGHHASTDNTEAPSASDITIAPVGVTRHRLMLPTPAFTASASPIELSTLQLCDLADVLEQADRELQVVPDETLPAIRSLRPKLPLWIGSVAAVGIAAILGSQWLITQPLSVVQTRSDQAPEALSQDQELQNQELLTGDNPNPLAESAPETAENAPAAAPENARNAKEPTSGQSSAAPSPTSQAMDSAPQARTVPPSSAPSPPPTTQEESTPPLANRAPEAEAPAAATSSPAGGSPPTQRASAPATEPDYPAPATAHDNTTGPAAAPAPPAETPADEGASLPPAPAAADAPLTLESQPAMKPYEANSPSVTADRSSPAWPGHLATTLQQAWTPPANLATALTYQLAIDQRGILQTVTPLSPAAAEYQAALPLPTTGSIIEGFPQGQSATVVVQFLPSGQVMVDGVPGNPDTPANQE